MSQYLSYTFKHKNGTVLQVDGYSTTVARELSDRGIFPYAVDPVMVTPEMLQQHIHALDEFAGEEKRQIAEYREKVSKYTEMLPKCATPETYDRVKDDIADAEAMIDTYKDYREMWLDCRHLLGIFGTIMTDNPDWGLYYQNC